VSLVIPVLLQMITKRLRNFHLSLFSH
jgi:hypothetical protein